MSRVFRGKFIAGLRRYFQRNKLVFHGDCLPLAQEKAFAAFLRTLFRQEWIVYAKHRLVAPSTFCSTWHATRIASPSPTIDCFRSTTTKCASAGRTMLITTSAACSRCRTKSSCNAFYSTYCPRAFHVFAISAGSRIENVAVCCPSAGIVLPASRQQRRSLLTVRI